MHRYLLYNFEAFQCYIKIEFTSWIDWNVLKSSILLGGCVSMDFVTDVVSLSLSLSGTRSLSLSSKLLVS